MNRFANETIPRVLAIPELLQRIFEVSEDEANVTNACVCKAWNEEATRVIWHDVPTGRVFSLLAPLTSHRGENGANYFSFSRAIREDDWDRFDRYSSKVYSLRFTQTYDSSVFKWIALGRRRLDFLPNLGTLYDAPPTALFAYPRIKRLIFKKESFTSDEVICWLMLIEHRMPDIEQLYIRPQIYPSDKVFPAFTSFLQRATFLKKLDVPIGFINDSNFRVVASMPNLQRIGTKCPFWYPNAGNFSSRSLSELPTSPFRSLQEFSVHLDFNTAVTYLTTLDSFRRLRVLKITSDAKESFDNYMILLDVIGPNCPGLEVLELEREFGGVSSAITSVEANRRLEHMLQSLHRLESLSLQCFGVQGRFPLRDLPLFAHHSKTLKHLHLGIDSSLTSDDSIIPCVFPALKRLHFRLGFSSNIEPTEVANFLSRILPPDCEISSNSGSGDIYEMLELVKTWVPILIKVRMEERKAVAEGLKVEELV